MIKTTPILKFFNGGAIYICKEASTKMHQHHAIQLTISFNQTFEIVNPYQKNKNCRFAIIPENIPHQLNSNSEEYIVCIYLDPFNRLAQLLKNKFELKSQIIFVDNLLDQISPLEKWIEMKNNDLNELTINLVERITDSTPTTVKKDIRINKSI